MSTTSIGDTSRGGWYRGQVYESVVDCLYELRLVSRRFRVVPVHENTKLDRSMSQGFSAIHVPE